MMSFIQQFYQDCLVKFALMGLSHRPKHRPNGITKADCEASKSEDLLKRDFNSSEPLKKCVTDITEIKAKDGKLYVSAIFGSLYSTVQKPELDWVSCCVCSSNSA